MQSRLIDIDEHTDPKVLLPDDELASPCLSRQEKADQWQELEYLSSFIRSKVLRDGETVKDVLSRLPEIRRQVCIKLYGKEQVEEWEREWKQTSGESE